MRFKILAAAVSILICLQTPAFSFYRFASKELELKADVNAGETFDDNVTYSKDKSGDLITELGAGLSGKYEGKKQYAELFGHIRQQLFARNSNFHNFSEYGGLKYSNDITKADHVLLTDSISHAEEPRSFDAQFGIRSGRYSRTINNFDTEYKRIIGKRLQIKGRYGNEVTSLSREDLRDSMLNRATIDAGLFLSSATLINLVYQFAYRNFFDKSNSTNQQSGNNAMSNGILAGIRRYLTKQLYIETLDGFDFVSNYSGETSVKPNVNASIETELDERTHVKLLGFEWKTSTTSYETNLFNHWQLSGGFSHELTERLRGYLNGFYGRGKYSGTGIRDTLLGASVTLEYDLTDNLKAVTSYTFSGVDSNQTSREYTKNAVNVKMLYSF